MPRQSVPSYRLHKPSGQARTIIHGRHIYLGKYNSPESREKYARLLAELRSERSATGLAPGSSHFPNAAVSSDTTVSVLTSGYRPSLAGVARLSQIPIGKARRHYWPLCRTSFDRTSTRFCEPTHEQEQARFESDVTLHAQTRSRGDSRC